MNANPAITLECQRLERSCPICLQATAYLLWHKALPGKHGYGWVHQCVGCVRIESRQYERKQDAKRAWTWWADKMHELVVGRDITQEKIVRAVRKDRKNMSDKIEACTREEWRDVKGFERAYQVSSSGRARSLPRKYTSGRIMHPGHDAKGYSTVSLRRNRKNYPRRIHRLVLEAFNGSCPIGFESAHLNGTPSDNRICNLKWVTPKTNAQHRTLHGNTLRGENISNARLTEANVLEIKCLLKGGLLLVREIAERFGVARKTICGIKQGRTWSWVGRSMETRCDG